MPEMKQQFVIENSIPPEFPYFDLIAPPDMIVYAYSQEWVLTVSKDTDRKVTLFADPRYDKQECMDELAEQLSQWDNSAFERWAIDKREINRWLLHKRGHYDHESDYRTNDNLLPGR